MKKLLVVLSVICMLCPMAAAIAQENIPQQLIVGSTTDMSGSFYSDLWGNNTSDMDVRGLIHGYSTVAWQLQGNYAVNQTAIAEMTTALNPNGDKIYTFEVKNGLKWNNGDPITARDYIFTILLQSSPEIAALGTSNQSFAQFAGQTAFALDARTPFSGVRLLDDQHFSLAVRGELLPYFYELMYINVEPSPIQVIAPGVMVADDGNGAYLTSQPVAEGEIPVEFTTELIKGTLLGQAGYVASPKLTCGAYNLIGYDGVTKTATFEKNPKFMGNFEGRLPEIERLVFRPLAKDTMLEELKNGTVDVINKVVDGQTIQAGLAMMNTEEARSVTYSRSGLAFLSFACEDDTMAQIEARRAIGMSIDTNALCTEVMSGYALPVYGYYGLGQWMTAQDGERLAQFERYGYDPLGAKAMLVKTGWTYNADGQPFVEGVDDLRYKMHDSKMIPLEFRLALSKESAGAENIKTQLSNAATILGAKFEVTELPFAELLSHYYRQTERTYNVFLLGTNFSHVFDPYYAFNIADEYQGVLNTTGFRDEKLMKLAEDLRGVENVDVESYLEKWFSFQDRWVDQLPMLPLYSNVYFDFIRPDLYGYQINTHWSWSAAILYATFTQPIETPAPSEEPAAVGDDEMIIIP